MGLPPMHYLSRIRAERAAAMLAKTDDPIATIGAVGRMGGSGLFLAPVQVGVRDEPARVPTSPSLGTCEQRRRAESAAASAETVQEQVNSGQVRALILGHRAATGPRLLAPGEWPDTGYEEAPMRTWDLKRGSVLVLFAALAASACSGGFGGASAAPPSASAPRVGGTLGVGASGGAGHADRIWSTTRKRRRRAPRHSPTPTPRCIRT